MRKKTRVFHTAVQVILQYLAFSALPVVTSTAVDKCALTFTFNEVEQLLGLTHINSFLINATVGTTALRTTQQE